MGQQINDNYTLLAGLPIDDRIQKPTIAERDAISATRRFQGLKCFVVQTQTEYMLTGGILNSDWIGTAGANVTGALETIIEGFYALTAGKSTLLDWEVGDKFRGWIGNRYLVGTIISLPVSLPSDIDNSSKVDLAVDSNDIVSDRPIVTTSDYIDVTQLDGSPAKILGENISLSVIPPVTHFTPVSSNIKGYFQGVDNALGDIVTTTAGVFNRVHFTADQTTISAGPFYLSNAITEGTVASAIQSVVNGDNQKTYFTQDLISVPFTEFTTAPAGTYGGQLTVRANPINGQQRYSIEVYRTNNGGTPINSGVTGAPVGSLGVTVVAILTSSILDLPANDIVNISLDGDLLTDFSVNAGERLRYHVAAEKVGIAGGNVTMEVFYGTNYKSFYDSPVSFDTDAILNRSTVVGATTTNALNTLKTTSDGKLDELYVNNDYVAQNPPASLTSVLYESFPLMIRGQSNKMFLFYRQGADHATSKGIIQTRTSTDGGGTWTSATTLVSDPTYDCRNVSGGITPTGRIILFYMRYAYGSSLSFDQGYIYSDNEGATWSTYTTIPNGIHTFYSPYGNLISIGDGKIMANWYGETPATPTYSSYVITSSDNGASWSAAVAVATSTSIRYGEASYAYLDGGVVLGMIRNSVGSPLYQVISTNNGASWTNQGQVAFDSGTQVSPWITTHIDPNNEKQVSIFYANRSDNKLRVSSADYTSAITGTANWNPRIDLASHTITDFGYPTLIKSRDNNKFLLGFYKASSTSLAAINFINYTPTYNNILVTGTITSSGNITTSSNVNATTGSLNGKEINATNFFTIKGNQTSFPTIGSGFELYNQPGVSILQSYDRTGAVYNQLNFRGSFHTWSIGATEKMRLHASGGVSIGNTSDLGAGTLNVTGNITTIAATTANHVVIKSQLDAVASSGTFTPSTIGSFTFSKSYWVKVGNVVTCTINGTYSASVSGSSTLALPNSFTINTPVNGRVIGTSPLLVLGSVNTRYAAVEEHTTNSQVTIRIETSVGSNIFSIPFTFLAN